MTFLQFTDFCVLYISKTIKFKNSKQTSKVPHVPHIVFDKVAHMILIRKIGEIGIGGQMLGWIKQFLRNRKQSITIEGEVSGSDKLSAEYNREQCLGQ